MTLKRAWGTTALLLALCAATARANAPSVAPSAPAPDSSVVASCPPGDCPTGTCATGTCATGECGPLKRCCCPKYVFTIEKPPCIKWKCVCPKPLCEPCTMEGYGYFPTCWRPFAYPPNYEHCPAPPPGVLASAPPPLMVGEPGPSAPGATTDESLPQPKRLANPNPDR